MKMYIYGIMSLFILIGCGSSSEKYKIEDDGNGTRSPRISKVVITNYNNEDNTSDETTVSYDYDKNNLLVSKKEHPKNSDEFIPGTRYTYNAKKQIKEIYWWEAMFIGGSSEFIYGETMYHKSKLPSLEYNIHESGGHGSGRTVKISYVYDYNDKAEVVRLKSSTNILSGSTMPGDGGYIGSILAKVQYIYDNNGRIIEEQRINYGTPPYQYETKTKYTYDEYGKLTNDSSWKYIYNSEHLLIRAESNDGDSIKKYFYENKAYYSNPSPSYLDQGQYSSSGIY